MATNYRIYRNSGGGPSDPIDYATVIASGASSPITLPALTAPGDYLIGIRAYDTVSGDEETNADAWFRLRIDAGGADITALPNAPGDVGAVAVGTTSMLVTWTYAAVDQGGAPTGFRVWANTGALDYLAAVQATVAYAAGQAVYSATITGLSAGSTYAVGVRAYNATGTEPNTAAATTLDMPSGGPEAAEGLTAAETTRAR